MVKPTLIGAILASKKKPEVESKDEAPESKSSFALEAASEALLEAIENKDAKALQKALTSFIQQCPDMDLAEDDEA